ncbi:MAG TPA: aldolase/citrate lyase family protein [Pseudolabrys sp.]|nr:aldolase/citrate lyase family protein [Pseudolabrys sp.]
MAAFSLAERLRVGETVFSAWTTLASPLVVEAMAREGFGAVNLDAQHGMWDVGTLIAGIGAVRAAGAAPLVRVPPEDFGLVSRALDLGAEAIIAPMINTAADARRFVAAAKYPPLGERSWGPVRAMMLQGQTTATDYLREANAGTLTMAMIETPAALRNAAEIAGTPGIDCLFVGPYDLATSLSEGKAQDITAAEVERAVDAICAAAAKAGKIPGIYCRDPARAVAMAKRGFRFIAVASDLNIFREGTAAILNALKN